MEQFEKDFDESYVSSGVFRSVTVAICNSHGLLYRRRFPEELQGRIEVFNIASLTKILTTVACLQLCEDGLLDLSDSVSRFLPEFDHACEHGTASRRSVISRTKVTIRHCLNHTAGMSYPFDTIHPKHLWTSVEKEAACKALDSREDLKSCVEDAVCKTPLLFEPGTHFNYAEGHNVVARIVELVSGQSFSEFVRQRITEPLGMLNTNFPNEDGWGDTGLKSTVDDLLLLNRMLLGEGIVDGTRILSAESVHLLRTNTLPPGAELARPFALDAATQSSQPLTADVGREDELSAALRTYRRTRQGPCSVASPHFGVPRSMCRSCRPANSAPGHGFGLGVAVVLSPEAACLPQSAQGTCWWQGYPSKFFAFNCQSDVGCVVVGSGKSSCFTTQQALADVIGIGHELFCRGRK
eukprot:TRINITY_DN49094_c0_g1_i1.p1 TRINITY_DN49094_c0_g1~~TRINITY_DN49094_c0_g1_i1.p1  ORF type:complete len:410 (-),score=40.58 TRINITY_DN49094_c0_g1_i1:74-1303(-)